VMTRLGSTTESISLGSRTTPSFRDLVSSCFELTKPRLTFLAVLTTLLGFYFGSQDPIDLGLLFHTLFGASLVGGGVNALNQFFERDTDAKMKRTQARPLPSGRLQDEQAFNFGLVISVVGILHLAFFVNPLTSFVATLIFVTYLVFYTPLKKKTPLSTLVGALPGALPPVLGWIAARGSFDLEAWVLFAILFFWQMPHFLAIAWVCREDYARAGFPMFTVLDKSGKATIWRTVFYSTILSAVSLVPAVIGMTGPIYFFAAAILGISFLGFGLYQIASDPSTCAKKFFLASILYLPLLIAAMMLDKVWQ